MRTESVGEFIFGAYRYRVLGLLFGKSATNFHVREISRISDVPAGSLHRELKRLAAHGLVKGTRVGNQLRYQANEEAVFSKALASILQEFESFESRSKQSKAPKEWLAAFCGRHRIVRLGVFGAVARGNAESDSPVDVLVEFETGVPAADVDRLRKELSNFLGREAIIATDAALEDPARREAILRELKILFPS